VSEQAGSRDRAATRRHFTADYKRKLLAAVDACAERGDRTALLEREGLLWSHVAKWRRQRETGQLDDSWVEAGSPARLLQLLQERDALLDELDRLHEENSRLRRQAAGSLVPHGLREALGRLLGRAQPDASDGETGPEDPLAPAGDPRAGR